MSSSGIAELQRFTAISKYARHVKELSRREVWPETVDRYAGMMAQAYPHRAHLVKDVCKATEAFEVMPSMRGLQFGGAPVFQHNARLYNCTGSHIDRLRFFAEAFYLLLCGAGVGGSVQERHIRHLPNFSKKVLSGAKLPKQRFVIPDRIEGWADCANVMMSAYHAEPVKGFEQYHECEPVFVYEGIRDEGSELSFGIGRAPGPVPLRKANERVRSLLNRGIAEGLTKLNSIYAYDTLMHYADAVVSGGVRRSATIILFDLWDRLMMMAKTGNWRATNPQRGRSNNSAILVRGQVSWEDFQRLFQATKEFGEPGFYWVDHPDGIPNPCVEIGFWPLLKLMGFTLDDFPDYQGPVYVQEDGTKAISGWQMCNLSTINGKTIKGENKQEKAEDFYRRCEQAALLGTWQAGFTKFPYLGPVSEEIAKTEALLGVSISGMMHHPDVFLDPEVLQAGAKKVLATNESEAAAIGIKPCARGTCEKPDGNSAATLGSFSGAHAGKFRKGFRIVQVNKLEKPYQHFKATNPQACEPSVWSANGTDDVVRFCAEYEGKLEDDMTPLEFLGCVRLIQQNWVEAGKVKDRCTQPWLSHNVSNTVRVRDGDWDAVAEDIYRHQYVYSGVSFIGWYGDRDYPQAPFTAVFDEAEQRAMYPGVSDHPLTPVLAEWAATAFRDIWDAADFALGNWAPGKVPTHEQQSWLKAFESYAHFIVGGDARRATYALKDHHNWRLFQRLKASYVPVDYSQMVETENGVKLQGEQACAGGACEL